MYVIFTLYKMEELIACKYEDISNRRKALYMEILMSSKNDRLLEDMLKNTISTRKKLEKIDLYYNLRKRKIITKISNPTIQKLMDENNDKKTEVKIKLLFSKSKDESTELKSQLNSLSKEERKLIRKLQLILGINYSDFSSNSIMAIEE